jgi:hypothetical protein
MSESAASAGEEPEARRSDDGVLEPGAALELLREGEMEIEGRLLDASNATLYCAVSLDGVEAHCVYKPVRGERPLWDFPDGTLADREVAAYLVSEQSGWDVVPPTVRRDGPFGVGMAQLWIEADESVDLAALVRSDHPGLRRMALFDSVINNADRKGGHLLPMPSGHVYGIDHGVSFHVDDKLRTLLWGWRGRKLSAEEVDVLGRLRAGLSDPNRAGTLAACLAPLLSRAELRATRRRLERLLSSRRFPVPSGDWPAIPWPPF